ncbi:MAG: hypothetical protein ABIH46_10775 [Chloroflexota bacterium]
MKTDKKTAKKLKTLLKEYRGLVKRSRKYARAAEPGSWKETVLLAEGHAFEWAAYLLEEALDE